MMSVTAAPANIFQALMGADTAAPPEQPAANAAQFAALIAGIGMPPQTVEVDPSTLTADAETDDDAGGDLPTKDGAAQPDAEGETDPLAAALAMLPAAMQQAMVAQPTTAGTADSAAQPMPAISPAALAKMLHAKAGASKDDAATDLTGQGAPFELDGLAGQALKDATGIGASGDTAANGTAMTVDPKAALPQGAPVHAMPTLAHAAKGDKDGDAAAAPPRADKDKGDDGAVDALAATDTVGGATGTPVPQPASQTSHASGAQGTATSQTPIAHELAQQHLNISSDGQWLDQLARDIATTADANGKLSFHLNPEHLGSLTVEVTRGPEGASVRLTADTDAARTILIDAQPKLESEARAQGVKIAETHVDLGGQNAQGPGTHGQGARQQAQAQAEAGPLLRAVRAGDRSDGAATNSVGSARGAAAELYA